MNDTRQIRVSTLVPAPPAETFRIFTEEIDQWWKRGRRFRLSTHAASTLRFEGADGGRLVEIAPDLEGGRYEFGRVLVWKPAEHLVFEFRARANRPGEESRVDVRFGAEARGTRVTLVQTGWESLPADHPVRHGLGDEAFFDMMSVFWADLLCAARLRAVGTG